MPYINNISNADIDRGSRWGTSHRDTWTECTGGVIITHFSTVARIGDLQESSTIYVSFHSLLGQYKSFHDLTVSLKIFREDSCFNYLGMLLQISRPR